MQTIHEAVSTYGGLKKLRRRRSPLCVNIDPDNFIEIKSAGRSPSGRPAVEVCFLQQTAKDIWNLHSEVKLEVTDLGWLPFYLRRPGDILHVYRGRRARPRLRVQLAEIVAAWDAELEVHLGNSRALRT